MRGNLSARSLTVSTLAVALCGRASAQTQDVFRIKDATVDTHSEYRNVELGPGEEYVWGDFKGPGKVTFMVYTDGNNGMRYRGLVLKVYWDAATEPSIRVPLADFFGAMESFSIDYQSIAMQVTHYNHQSYLPMPFSKRARFVLSNDGDRKFSQAMAWSIDYEKNPEFGQETSRLHASWSRSNPVENGLHPILKVNGKGHYIGNFLQVNTTYPYPGWWGEGNVYFDLDGKKITHTEGTEDEYGSSWGFEYTHSAPYNGYIQMDKEKGRHRMYRWYLANPVRFQKSLNVTIENRRFQGEGVQFKSFEDATRAQVISRDDYTSVAFWYQEGAHAVPALPPYAQRIAPPKGVLYPDRRSPPE